MKTEAETGAMQPHAKGGQGLQATPEARREAWTDSPLEPLGGPSPADTLVLGSRAPELGGNTFLLF